MSYLRRIGAITLYAVTIVLAAALIWRTVEHVSEFRMLRRESTTLDGMISSPPVHDVIASQVLHRSLYRFDGNQDVADYDGLTILAAGWDSCLHCGAAWAVLNRVLAASSNNGAIRLMYVSPEDDAMPSAFAGIAARKALLHIRELREFVERTGITFAPLIMAIDGERRVRCLTSGVPEEVSLRACIEGNTRGTTFLKDPRTELIGTSTGEQMSGASRDR